MAKFIRLDGIVFNNNNLPVLVDMAEQVSLITSLHSWLNAEASNYSYSNGDLVVQDLVNPSAQYEKAPSRVTGPVIADGVLNGRSVIRFAGDGNTVGGLKKNVDDMPNGANTKLTFALVALVTSPDTSTQNIMCSGATGSDGVAIFSSGTETNHSIGLNGGNALFESGKTWKIMIGSVDGTTVKSLSPSDLATVSTGSGSSSNLLSTMYLGQSSALASKFVGDIAEALVFSDDLLASANSADLANLIDYLKTKFAI
tara:strand:- start:470 stop:1237 length:768 start_codon:yes stop_codon:yes gene_type:complete